MNSQCAVPLELIAPGPVLLLGAPGVGKGTQAKFLMATFQIPQISTGDLLRENRRNHTELGLLAEEVMSRGQLVPDDMVNNMVAIRLERPDCIRGFILDGFPRTLAQAYWLDSYLERRKGTLPVVALKLFVDRNELLRRITGRRVCSEGHIYNVYSHPPLISARCDLDQLPLEQRDDDTETVFEQRMRTFHEQTDPVIDHYRALDSFSEVDGFQPVEKVATAIRESLEYLRRRARTGRGKK